jgi:hypothetical protein
VRVNSVRNTFNLIRLRLNRSDCYDLTGFVSAALMRLKSAVKDTIAMDVAATIPNSCY